jgi:hypothetical protein
MASTSETGHAKNVANFSLLLAYLREMGPDYNPANPNIMLPALELKESAAKAAMKAVTDALIPSKNAINERDREYTGMSKIATRIINALAGSGVHADILKDARGVVNKIIGTRTGKKKEPDPNNPEGKSISTNQMSFDNRKANFEILVAMVKGQTLYNPNEAELKVTALEGYITRLDAVNATVNSTEAALNEKRNLRYEVLYGPVFGISELTGTIKKYVKSAVGVDSPVYKRIAKIQIKKIENK